MTTDTFKLAAFASFAVVATVMIAVSAYRERKRREDLAQAAIRLGFQFAPHATALPEHEYGPLALFGRGHSKRAYNVLRGSASSGGSLALFDYKFVTGRGKHRTTHLQTVAVFTLSNKTLPGFALRPEGALDRLGEVFGWNGSDIDFEHQAEFSKAYHLRAGDEANVRTLFQPQVLAHFGRERGWHVEGRGAFLLVYRAGKRIKSEDVRQYVDEVSGIARLFA